MRNGAPPDPCTLNRADLAYAVLTGNKRTQAAADFLINPEAMNSVLRKARETDGTFRPFELLLETSSIGGNAPEARVIAERYAWDQTSLQQQ